VAKSRLDDFIVMIARRYLIGARMDYRQSTGGAMRKVILITLLAFASGNAMAEWAQIGGYGRFSIYTDPTNIQRDGKIVTMWNVSNYNVVQSAEGKNYLSVEEQDEFDCDRKKMRIMYFAYRSGQMGEGEPVYSKSFSSDTKWDPVEPDTTSERIYKFACSGK